MTTCKEILEQFRRAEKDNRLTLSAVLLRPNLRLLLGAWPLVDIDFNPQQEVAQVEVNASRLWDELWIDADYDITQIAEAMGCDEVAAEAALNQAIALRMIYPDGTISAPAALLCQAHIADSLRRAARRAKT